jgi:hypothetical protein
MLVAPPIDELFPVSQSSPAVEAYGDLSLAGVSFVFCFLELPAVFVHLFPTSFDCESFCCCQQFLLSISVTDLFP